MAPRGRSPKKRNWPDRLYERDGYFSWRHPVTGKEYGLGRDRADAFQQAIEANHRIAQQTATPRLIDRLTGAGRHTVAAWFATYADDLGRRELAANTRKSYKSLSKRAVATLGPDRALRSVTALEFSDAVRAIETEGKPRLAQAFRSFCRDALREAVVRGWLDQNPVRDVKAPQVKVKRARLTLDVFRAIYRDADPVWLKNAMALAIVTGQRREDISAAAFSDVREGCWWVRQSKTGAQIAIPLELRLEAVSLSLGDVVKQCRGTRILSRHLIHQTQPAGNSPVGSQIWVDTISRRFTAAVTALGRDWGDKTPPTFHEIRSLSERLYSSQGDVNTQELLGHRDARMTATYHDGRGSEWVRIKVGS